MGGVELHYQLKCAYGLDRKVGFMFYLKFWFDFMDSAAVNSLILYNKSEKDPLTLIKFKERPGKQLLGSFSSRHNKKQSITSHLNALPLRKYLSCSEIQQK